ncbi:DUF2510 domain-containing protein [Tessaracoccus sp. HDW20]|uniref:DUF2510 domain-containing protein n=1 Tax=Tessaracoccus coleopterorum TaxID=2714950 RepID=UPI0018D4326C|nr:DUF2510 domain-containing protein [Tessaracoccus coleopterorum]NHB84045.1 DUF2510 domain-containing protein [Tessaracoccus coleopterorum]
MAQPGWYADPTAPDGRRYWDGQRWLEPVAPKRSSGAWLWLGIALVVVASIVVAMVLWPNNASPFASVREDTRSARPTGEQWNERKPSETPSPTPVETGFGQSIICPHTDTTPRSEVKGGRLHGGGLSIEAPRGEWVESPAWISWMHEDNSMLRPIATGWISNVNLGYILVSDGFSSSLPQAAEEFMSCMASSGMFDGFERRDLLRSEDFNVDGRIGWRLTSNIYVSNQRYQGIEGDTVDLVLVPTGKKDRIAVYVTCATIDKQDNQAETKKMLESLRWEG